MKKSQFSPIQFPAFSRSLITAKQQKKSRVIKASIYNWRQGYGGMETSELKRKKELEEENARLKHMYANLVMELDTAKYIIEKKLKDLREAKDH